MKPSEKDYQDGESNDLKLNRIKRFFLFSSGANFSLLNSKEFGEEINKFTKNKKTDKEVRKKEVNKFTAVGATVVLTAVLATLSGGYAFNFVFDNVFLSLIFGVFWGIVIYNLDRYIVMSLRKGKSQKLSEIVKETDPVKKRSMIYDKISTFFNTLFMASPRIVIALVIALSVSKPLELRLFNNTIERELGKIKTHNISEFETKFQAEIDELNEKIILLNEKESEEKESVYSKNPIYQTKLKTRERNEVEIQNINTTTKANEKIIAKNKYLKTEYKNVTKYYPDGTPYIVREPYKYWAKNRTARAKEAENKKLRKRRAELYKEQSTIKQELSEIEKEFKGAVDGIAANYKASKKPLLEQIEHKNNSYSSDLIEWKSKVSASTDLLSRLEALGNITAKRNVDGSRSSAYWASLLITLLFISLETAPVIVKLLTKRGPYDELLDRLDYECFIHQQEAISTLNSRVNTTLEKIKDVSKLEGQMFLKVEQQKLEAELKSNELLLNDIAEKQAQLAKLKVEKWYENELEKINKEEVAKNLNPPKS